MSKQINVEMSVEELRTVVSLLETHPNHHRVISSQKAGGTGNVDAARQACLKDRLSLRLSQEVTPCS